MQALRQFLSRNRRIGIWIVVVLAVVAGGWFLIDRFWHEGPNQTGPVPVPLNSVASNGRIQEVTIEKGATMPQTSDQGVYIRLSEGQSQPQAIKPSQLVPGQPLLPEDVERILARLPELPTEPEDQADFRLAQDPIPPPRAGKTVEEKFPPDESPVSQPEIPSGPLEVLRYSPEGEISVAPFMSVSFNQPMVPLGTLENLAALDVPVEIEPQLQGTWRWLGTKTLTFEYDSDLIDRLPKATEYRVTIPAGTTSQTGGVLAKAVTWTFTTPPPQVLQSFPDTSPQGREPLLFVAFDQRIDASAVLEKIRLQAGGNPIALRMATAEEIKADATVSRLVKYAQDGRWLVFRPGEILPADTEINVTLGPGVPSAEGPLVNQQAYQFSFRTYAPLRIEEHGCAWSEVPCQPLSPLFIRFNNAIDASVYTEEQLTVDPAIPGVSVNIYGNTLEIRGATRGQTTYQVTVSGEIQDIFGQKLGKTNTLTFKVGPAEPLLFGNQQNFITLDPSAKNPIFSVYTVNFSQVHYEIYAVQPADWGAFQNYLREWQRTDQPPSLPGRKVADEVLRIEAPSDQMTQVDIELKPYLDGAFGHLVVKVEPPKGFFEGEDARWKRYSQTTHAWVQITQIGLDAFTDHSEMLAWATSLVDGSPLAGVTIQPATGGAFVTTAEGTARFPIPSGALYLVAKLGADQAMLPRSTYYWGSEGWQAQSVRDELRWYVFDDRQMYRPGEEVHIKGWLRRIGGKQDGDVSLLGPSVSTVQYRITDSQGNDLGGGQTDVNALGGFDLSFVLPTAVNLGYTNVQFTALGSLENLDSTQYYHGIQIQEFRRPEFEVTARNETSGPYFAGEFAVLAVEAKYYAGDPLPDAEVTWQVNRSTGTYSPPNWPDFTFGTWQPWWWFDTLNDSPPQDSYEVFSGKTDASGTHYLRLDFEGGGETRPISIVANASVMDVNRQAWASTTTLLVHPASLYVGLRSERYFVERGTPIKVDVIVTDLDGNPQLDRPVEVQAARLEWKYRGGEWSEEEADVQTCTVGSQLQPQTCSFATPIGGRYRITATVTDPQGRQNQSQITRWVSGGQRPPQRKVEQEEVTLIPDKENYQPGETAEILVQSPFSPAEGLLTVTRNGILYTERFSLQDGTTTLRIPIEDRHIPNLNIQVELVGAAARTDDKGEPISGIPARPAYASGSLVLNIPPLQRTLTLKVTPAASELEPGGETTLDLELLDVDGRPVSGAELAVVVVDEAILALTNYQLADPLSAFYSQRPSYLESIYGRSSIILVDPLSLLGETQLQYLEVQKEVERAVMEEAPMMAAPSPTQTAAADSAREGETSTPIRVRTDFNPLATFAPAVRTDADGKARVQVNVPDNLTRYRVMVVAVDASGRQFGQGEANLTARLPLMVRPSAPRFLNFGDRFELPVIVQNQTGEPLVVDVVVRSSNLTLTEYSGLRVEVPAHNRVEVRFPAAAESAGTARLQIAAVSGSYADAATVELPVYTPATTEAFATYGVIDEGAIFQSLLTPSGVFPQYGGLEVNTSSTALQALTDAVLYLVAYPYECSEQLASRILAVAALRDVLTAFQADGLPSPEEMQSAVQRDIERLAGLQNDDGGFPYWRRGFDSVPFNTLHVAHALQRAQAKGFSVPVDMQARTLDYLRTIESHYPTWYNQHIRWTLSAYALFVRNLSGDRDPDKALKLISEAGLENLSMEAIGWLWPVLQDAPNTQTQLEAIRRFIGNRVVETAGAANFTTYYDDQTYLLLSSDRRTDAILLDALIGDNPQSDLIPKLVNGLLAHRKQGRWGNTQENVFVLLALDRYFNTFEGQTPDFVARLWLGDLYAGSSEFKGRTTERHETLIPMSYVISQTVAAGGSEDIILSKDGPGRLYYRLGLRYAPSDLNLDALDMGFVVQRRYEGVDDPEDVYQDEQGIWHIKAGARVRIRISLVADNRRYHVALVDPLPAGLEIVNPSLAVSQSAPADPADSQPTYRWWWYWSWYEHQNLRDERAEAFTTLLWEGVYEYSYIARATTPGTFVVPPAKAEEMYSPEVFGRSASDWLIVEDR